METRAVAKYVRVAPRKARLVVDMIRGAAVEEALSVLKFSPKRAAKVVEKTLRSAVANAEENTNADVDRLYVKSVWVDEGPVAGRYRPRAQGRATAIRKRSSHITVVVDERGGK
jgi:large subunit ribosomal protein L22